MLLAVKAYDTRWACEMIKPHVADNGMVIGMQNCMVAGVIREVIGPERSIACVLELSSEMFTPGQVKRNTPPKKTWIGLGLLEGGPGQRLEEMQTLLGPVGKVEIKENILAAKWTKLVVNAMCLGPSSVCISSSRWPGPPSSRPSPIQVFCGGVLRFTRPGVNISDDSSITQAMLRSGPITSRMTSATMQFCMPMTIPFSAR